MANGRLKLSRDQLAAFLKDHQSIRQFELLFTVADEVSAVSDTQGISFAAENAVSKAQEALDTLNRIANALDMLAVAPANAEVTSIELVPPTLPETNGDILVPTQQIFNEEDIQMPFPIGSVAEKDYTRIEFSPTLSFGGASVGLTYSTRNGLAVKIADVVFVTCNMRLTNKGASIGNALISGLPFVSRNSTDGEASLTVQANNMGATAITSLSSVVANNSSAVTVSRYAAGAAVQLTDVDFANNSVLRLSGIYFTS